MAPIERESNAKQRTESVLFSYSLGIQRLVSDSCVAAVGALCPLPPMALRRSSEPTQLSPAVHWPTWQRRWVVVSISIVIWCVDVREFAMATAAKKDVFEEPQEGVPKKIHDKCDERRPF